MCQLLAEHCFSRHDKNNNIKAHTHTWFGSGDYKRLVSLVDSDVIEKIHLKLFQLIKGKLPHNLRKWNSLTEKISSNGKFRMFADLDFKPSVVDTQPDFEQFKTDMQSLIDVYKGVVEECIDGPITEWYVATRMFYKFHLHFPEVIVDGKTAKHINERFREVFEVHPILSKYYNKDVVDSSVYSTGLRMLWCHKGSMIKPEQLQKTMNEHIEKFGEAYPYEHCYYLIDPETMMPLPLDVSHLKKTSICTEQDINCRYVNPKLSVGKAVKIMKKHTSETEECQEDAALERQKQAQSEELTFETQEIVKHEISTRFECYTPADVNKIIDFENYLIAAISKTTCPLKGGDHSKNHPYVVICSNGLRLKCHNALCKTIGSQWYPISVELQMALDEHGKRLIPFAEGYLVKNMLKQIYIPQWSEDLQSAFTAYLNNYVAMFLGPNGGISYLYRNTPDTPWSLYSKERVREILNKFNTIVTYVQDGNTKTHHIRIFETWMTNINRREITKVVLNTSYMGDDPEHPHIWNVWTGFKIVPEKIVDESVIAPVLYHIKEVYCCGDDKKYQCFMNWLTHLVKEPSLKLGTAFILRGSQGVGKNIMLDWFGREVIGMQHYHEYNSMEDLINRFNGDSEYKIFCICNEISNWGGCLKTNDLLKNRITNQRTRIERKGIDAHSAEDYQNFIFTTNNNWVVRVTSDDRRYNVLETSSKHKGDAQYFKNLADCLKKVETAEMFLGYLFSRKLNCVCGGKFVSDPDAPLINVHEAIWTEEKKDLLQMSKESITSFVDDLVSGRISLEAIPLSRRGSQDLTNARLYAMYCDHHERGNYANRVLDIQKFGIAFKKEIERYPGCFEKKVLGPREHRVKGWAIILPALDMDEDEQDEDEQDEDEAGLDEQ